LLPLIEGGFGSTPRAEAVTGLLSTCYLARHHSHPPPTPGYQDGDIGRVAGKYVIVVLSDEYERSINRIYSTSLR
jgi:hypothetical protein